MVGEVQTAVAGGVFDITTPQFARRFGALVRERRLATGDSIRSIARGSAGVVTVGLLRDIEDARVPLDHELVSLVASRYGADLAAILPERMSVSVSDDGVIRSGPAERRFCPGDETALLTAYLALVRSMRRERDATIVLRRDDIEVLAAHLRQPGSVVLDRLLSIMGSGRTQRSAVLALFARRTVCRSSRWAVHPHPDRGGPHGHDHHLGAHPRCRRSACACRSA